MGGQEGAELSQTAGDIIDAGGHREREERTSLRARVHAEESILDFALFRNLGGSFECRRMA